MHMRGAVDGGGLPERGLLGSGDERYLVRGVCLGLVAGEGERAGDRLVERDLQFVGVGGEGETEGSGDSGRAIDIGFNSTAGPLGVRSTGWERGKTAATCAAVTRWPARFGSNRGRGRGDAVDVERDSPPAAAI